jgi:formylglycine-generating enzyme required for sulfatase activity
MKARVWCFLLGIVLCGQPAWGAHRVRLELVGELVTERPVADVALKGDYAYVARLGSGLCVVDLSDPVNPQETAHLFGRGVIEVRKVLLFGQRAVAFHGQSESTSNGLSILDITQPATPLIIGHYEKDELHPTHAAISDNLLFVSSRTGLHVFDLSQPNIPDEIGLLPTDYIPGSVIVIDHIAYVQEDNRIHVIDVSEPSAPRSIRECRLGNTTKIRRSGDSLCVIADGRLHLIDVSQPASATSLGEYRPEGLVAVDVQVKGTLAFLLTAVDPGHQFNCQIHIVDIADPSKPHLIGSHCISGSTAVVSLDAVGAQLLLRKSSGLEIYRLTELPAITRQTVTGNMLSLQWNEPARGMKLQRATSLTNPDWHDMPGSETVDGTELELWSGQEYWRLAYDGPANMVWIPPGTFVMGSPEDEPGRHPTEGPQTEVTLRQGFWMGKYEVTQGEYLGVTGHNPSYYNGGDYGTELQRPVESVTWKDAIAYCEALTMQELAANQIPAGFAYRLPTEAEYEYACRAGTATRYSHGDDPEDTELENYAWYNKNAEMTTHPVGQRQPNPWGLYDILGNVWEHTADWWSDSLPGGSVVDPTGPATGWGHVPRGGSWSDVALRCRSADRRGSVSPSAKFPDLGFRVVLAPAQP